MAFQGGRRSDAEGCFEVFAQQSAEIELWAWSQHSAPSVIPRHIGPSDEVDLGDVVLPGGLALGGRVLLAGRPSPYGPAAVHVMRTETTGVMGSFEWGVVFDAAGRPLSASRIVTTAEDGAWSVEGLSPGTYHVRIQHLGGTQFHEGLRVGTTRKVTAPASGIDFDLPASLLAVAPASAGRSDGSKRQIEVTTADGTRTRILHPGERGLVALALTPIEGVQPGDDLLLVPSETRLALWVQDAGLEGWRTSAVSARAGEVLRINPAPREGQEGWIKLRRAADAQGLTSHVRVRVTVPGTGDLVVEQTLWLVAPDFVGLLKLPLGTWSVDLWPADAPQASDAELLLLQTERVEVGPTLETAPVLSWSPPRGGRIRLRVEVPGDKQPGVTCFLLREGQPAQVPLFRSVVDVPGMHRAGMWVTNSPLTAGALMETDGPLAPGGVRLRLECEGFEPHEEPVVIRPGETSDVTVRLTPR